MRFICTENDLSNQSSVEIIQPTQNVFLNVVYVDIEANWKHEKNMDLFFPLVFITSAPKMKQK